MTSLLFLCLLLMVAADAIGAAYCYSTGHHILAAIDAAVGGFFLVQLVRVLR